LENRGNKDNEVFRGMWKEVESRKADKARIEEAGGERGKERNKETNSRRRKNNSENNSRKRG